MTHANSRQVGGNHYVGAIQHWDIAALYELGYYEGQITKYVARHAKKNKAQDVEKALHFLDKLVELHVHGGKLPQHADYPHLPGRDLDGRNPVQRFCEEVQLPNDETMVINKMCLWRTHVDLVRVRSLINAILQRYTEADVALKVRDPLMHAAKRSFAAHDAPEDGSAPGPGYVNQDMRGLVEISRNPNALDWSSPSGDAFNDRYHKCKALVSRDSWDKAYAVVASLNGGTVPDSILKSVEHQAMAYDKGVNLRDIVGNDPDGYIQGAR